MFYLKFFLNFPLKGFIPVFFRVWHLLIVFGLVGLLVCFLKIHNPGGRSFDQGNYLTPSVPYTDIDNPKKILIGLDSELDSNDIFLKPVILHLARASDAVYASGESTVPRLFFETQFDQVVPLSVGPNAAIIGLKGDIAVVVFRGTDEIRDWYTNLSTSWHSVEHGKFHSGFWFAYQSLREGIIKTLLSRDLKRVWVCGHSLGGAMALCCGYDLTNKSNIPLSGVVTFGQPKLADAPLASHLNKALKGKYLAVVADEDPVSDAVPLCHFCGRAVWFNGDTVRLDGGQTESLKNNFPVAGSKFPELENAPSFKSITTENQLRLRQEMLRLEERPPTPNFDGLPLAGSALPYFRDHNMTNYIAKLRTYFGLNGNN